MSIRFGRYIANSIQENLDYIEPECKHFTIYYPCGEILKVYQLKMMFLASKYSQFSPQQTALRAFCKNQK